jgi:hypothetical protein
VRARPGAVGARGVGRRQRRLRPSPQSASPTCRPRRPSRRRRPVSGHARQHARYGGGGPWPRDRVAEVRSRARAVARHPREHLLRAWRAWRARRCVCESRRHPRERLLRVVAHAACGPRAVCGRTSISCASWRTRRAVASASARAVSCASWRARHAVRVGLRSRRHPRGHLPARRGARHAVRVDLRSRRLGAGISLRVVTRAACGRVRLRPRRHPRRHLPARCGARRCGRVCCARGGMRAGISCAPWRAAVRSVCLRSRRHPARVIPGAGARADTSCLPRAEGVPGHSPAVREPAGRRPGGSCPAAVASP